MKGNLKLFAAYFEIICDGRWSHFYGILNTVDKIMANSYLTLALRTWL